MNTEDFKPFKAKWEEIFQKQKELKLMYEPDAKELIDNFDIDCYEDQEAFKRYCWRITEELCEAIEAFESPEHSDKHGIEELIDALNFSIELAILYGWDFKDIEPVWLSAITEYDPISIRPEDVIYRLGLAANCLKNRQWRRSQYMTDLLIFEQRLRTFFYVLYKCLHRYMSDVEIRKAWSLKYQVNLFRINTNY